MLMLPLLYSSTVYSNCSTASNANQHTFVWEIVGGSLLVEVPQAVMAADAQFLGKVERPTCFCLCFYFQAPIFLDLHYLICFTTNAFDIYGANSLFQNMNCIFVTATCKHFTKHRRNQSKLGLSWLPIDEEGPLDACVCFPYWIIVTH